MGSSNRQDEAPSIRGAVGLGAGAAVLAAGLGALTIVSSWKPWWDAAIYLDLARSLLEEGSYSYMGEPHTKYPPGFPLLLAPCLALFGLDHAVLRAIGVLSAAAVAFLTPLAFRRLLPLPALALISLLVAVHPTLLFFESYVLSDIPYAAVSLLALLLLQETVRREAPGRMVPGMSAAVLLVGCLLRVVGFTLLLAHLVSIVPMPGKSGGDLRRRLVSGALVILPATLFLLAWWVRGVLVEPGASAGLREGVSYLSEFWQRDVESGDASAAGISGFLSRLGTNIPYYAGLLGSLVLGSNSVAAGPGRWILAGLVGIGVAASLVRGRREGRPPLLELHLVFNLGLLLLWPAREDLRFLIPLIPSVSYFAVLGPWLLIRRLSASTARPALVGWVAAFLLAIGPVVGAVGENVGIVRDERAESYRTPAVLELIAICDHLRDNTPDGARVVSDHAPWVHFWSRRPTFSYARSPDPEVVYEDLRRIEADYVVFSSLGSPHLPTLLRAFQDHREAFRVVRSEGKSVVVEVVAW